MTLNKLVKQMDRKLGLTKEYIQYQAKASKNGSSSIGALLNEEPMDYEYGGGGEGSWGENIEGEEEDETVMYDFQG